jgi:hypothetical protein
MFKSKLLEVNRRKDENFEKLNVAQLEKLWFWYGSNRPFQQP